MRIGRHASPGLTRQSNFFAKAMDARVKPAHDETDYAALRLDKNSPIRSSAFRIFSVEFAYDSRR